MQLLSFKGDKEDLLSRIGEKLIRWRTKGPYAHSAVMFEPKDGPEVAAFMPDGSLEPNEKGEYWIAESVWLSRIPMYSPRRAGKLGGAALRRCKPEPKDWDFDDCGRIDPVRAAMIAKRDTGQPYDLQAIFGFIAFVIPQKEGRVMCCEWAGVMFGMREKEAAELTPNTLPYIVRTFR